MWPALESGLFRDAVEAGTLCDAMYARWDAVFGRELGYS